MEYVNGAVSLVLPSPTAAPTPVSDLHHTPGLLVLFAGAGFAIDSDDVVTPSPLTSPRSCYGTFRGGSCYDAILHRAEYGNEVRRAPPEKCRTRHRLGGKFQILPPHSQVPTSNSAAPVAEETLPPQDFLHARPTARHTATCCWKVLLLGKRKIDEHINTTPGGPLQVPS